MRFIWVLFFSVFYPLLQAENLLLNSGFETVQ